MARATQSEFQRVRWRMYLEEAFVTGAPSRARVAEALDLPTSRVSQWLAGERGVEAETAYDIGELLRAQFGVPTTGAEAVYAAGYFGDVLRLLRAVALDERPGARETAIALYASLPGRFLAHDVRALDVYPRGVDGYIENDYEKHEAARVRRDGAIACEASAPEVAGARTFCAQALAQPQAASLIGSAWAQAHRPLDLPRVVMPRFLRPMPSAPAGMPEAGRASEIAEVAPQMPAAAPPPLEPPPLEAVAALIDVVIALARALEPRNPTLTAPRLWRMLAEWAIELDPKTYVRCAPALPSAFVPIAAEPDA